MLRQYYKVAKLLKAIHGVSEFTIKILVALFKGIRDIILTFLWRQKRQNHRQSNMGLKNDAGDITRPDFKLD